MAWVGAFLAVAVVLGAACGSRVDPLVAAPNTTAGIGSEAGEEAAASRADGTAAAAREVPGASGGLATSGGRAAPPGGTTTSVPPGSLPVSLTLSRTCATRGSSVTATVRTRPSASIVGAVEYADGDDHDTFAIGSADGTGTWRWPFVVSSEAPNGRATVRVSAQDRSPGPDGFSASTTGEEGTAEAQFEVKKTCP